MTAETLLSAGATVEVHDVHKWYGAHRVLNGVDLTVRPGEVTVILGPSGSGKSTLLRVVNHLEKPEIGHVSINGEPIGVRRHGGRLRELSERAILTQRSRIGFVFQNFNLFPHLTVLDNVAAAPVATGRLGKPAALELARDLLDRVVFIDEGKIVEQGPPSEVLDKPQHERTRDFLSKVL